MSKLTDFVQKVFPREGPDAGDVFPNIDFGKEATRLEVEKLGAERGKMEELPNSGEALDPIELRVTSHFSNHWNTASQRYHEYVAAYRRRLEFAVDMSGDVEEVALATVGDFEAIAKEAALHLYAPRQRVFEIDNDYWTFCDDNRLRRTAVPRKSHVFNIGVLLIALVAESALNGTFLAEVFGGAILIAFLFAVGISVINVLASLLCGIFSRYVQHVHPIKRLLGLLTILFFLAWLTGYNLFVGHFRDAAEGLEWEAALIDSVRRFIEAPHQLENFQSWMLALLGGLISVIVFIKGVFWDDFYPGYGPLSLRRDLAQDEYRDMAKAAIAEVGRVREESRADLQVAREHLLSGLSETKMILTEQSALSMQYFAYHRQIEDAANQVLGIYREAYQSGRPDGAAPPTRFGQPFKLPEATKIGLDEKVETDAEELKETFDTALKRARQAIEEAYRAALATIKRFEDLDLRSMD